MNFWETDEWISLKTNDTELLTDKVLTKTEYLKKVGHQAFSHEGYQKYLQAMENKQRKETEQR